MGFFSKLRPAAKDNGGPRGVEEVVLGAVRELCDKSLASRVAIDAALEQDLAFDSIKRTELLVRIEQAMSLRIPPARLRAIETVADIVELLGQLQAAPVGAPVAPRVDDAQTARSTVAVDAEELPHRGSNDAEAVRARRAFVEQKTGARLVHLSAGSVDAAVYEGNIEQYLGTAQVPLGLAGPVVVHGEHVQGPVYVPLALTEGAVIASITRGMAVINRSGGVFARVLADQMTKAPLFTFDRTARAIEFISFVREHEGKLKELAASTTRVGKLIAVEPILLGRRVILRLVFTTGDAAGQNMATFCTEACCQWLRETNPDLRQVIEDSKVSGDKFPHYINFHTTRGKKVVAEAALAAGVIRAFFHAEPEMIHAAGSSGVQSAMFAGGVGANVQYPNIAASLYIATGQDVACITEAAVGMTTTDLLPGGDLLVSVNLPNLILATVGGGTNKGTARECLEILGCLGPGKVRRLAEIAAATFLAGEISLLASITAGDFAEGHRRYARR